jgi:hypothetical protein
MGVRDVPVFLPIFHAYGMVDKIPAPAKFKACGLLKPDTAIQRHSVIFVNRITKKKVSK